MLLGSTLGTGEREVFSIKGLFGEDRLIERKLQANNVDVVVTAIKTNRIDTPQPEGVRIPDSARQLTK